MTVGAPRPRSGRLLGGGNSLELLWATVALAIMGLLTVSATIAWCALWVEGQFAGTGWHLPPAEMPGVLVELAAGRGHPSVHETVAQPWRPVAAAFGMVAALAGAGITGLRRWIDWRSGWRHRQRLRERLRSHSWARRRDLEPLLQSPPATGSDEPPAEGRLLVGSVRGRDVLVPARTSVMVVAPTRTGKSTRLVVPNLLRWDGPAVVTSVKRDVLDLTRTRRATHGPVALFDPTGATGLPSIRWSPLLTSTTFPDARSTTSAPFSQRIVW